MSNDRPIIYADPEEAMAAAKRVMAEHAEALRAMADDHPADCPHCARTEGAIPTPEALADLERIVAEGIPVSFEGMSEEEVLAVLNGWDRPAASTECP
jgi:hypothetical protein